MNTSVKTMKARIDYHQGNAIRNIGVMMKTEKTAVNMYIDTLPFVKTMILSFTILENDDTAFETGNFKVYFVRPYEELGHRKYKEVEIGVLEIDEQKKGYMDLNLFPILIPGAYLTIRK